MDSTLIKTKNIVIRNAVCVDPEGKIIDTHPEFDRLLGYSHQDLIGQSLSDIFPQENFLQDIFYMQKFLRPEENIDKYNFEKEVLFKNGAVKKCYLELEIIFDKYNSARFIKVNILGFV